MRLSTLIAKAENAVLTQTPRIKTRAIRAAHYVTRKSLDGIERLNNRVANARVKNEGLLEPDLGYDPDPTGADAGY